MKNVFKQNKYGKFIIGIIIAIISVIIIIYSLSIINKKTIQTNKAIKEEYISNVDMNYIKQDGIEVKIDYISLKDTKLDLVFNFKFEEDISIYEGINIPGILIKDEKDNQILYDIESEEHEKSFGKTMGWSIIEKNKQTLRQLLFSKSDQFPNSKKLYVHFDKIILYNVNTGNPVTREITGDWNIELDIDNTYDNSIYDTSVLEKYISIKPESEYKKIRIGEEQYFEKDIKFRQYFYGENSTETEVIDTIILSKEAKNSNIKVEKTREDEIVNRVNSYKFSKDFLKKVDGDEKVLKEKMIEAMLEIELKRCLLEEIDKEIFSNNITIDDENIKKEVTELYNYYSSLKTENVIYSSTDEEIEEIWKEYGSKMDKITDEYVNFIKKNIKIEYK